MKTTTTDSFRGNCIPRGETGFTQSKESKGSIQKDKDVGDFLFLVKQFQWPWCRWIGVGQGARERTEVDRKADHYFKKRCSKGAGVSWRVVEGKVSVCILTWKVLQHVFIPVEEGKKLTMQERYGINVGIFAESNALEKVSGHWIQGISGRTNLEFGRRKEAKKAEGRKVDGNVKWEDLLVLGNESTYLWKYEEVTIWDMMGGGRLGIWCQINKAVRRNGHQVGKTNLLGKCSRFVWQHGVPTWEVWS